MSDYKKLNNQPLVLALAEFRFSQVMQIEKYIPQLQEKLRKNYPISEEKSHQVFNLHPGKMDISALKSWSFISANKKSAITINQERLVYYTAEYIRSEDFFAACQQALEALASIVEPGLILRIGLRYGDLIKIDEGEKISDLVDPSFGFSKIIQDLGHPQHQRNELLINTNIGSLVIRAFYGKHNLTLTPDIQELPIAIKREDHASERLILDFDHFWESQNDPVNFETKEILKKLQLLHKISREAFWKVTTNYARNEKWA